VAGVAVRPLWRPVRLVPRVETPSLVGEEEEDAVAGWLRVDGEPAATLGDGPEDTIATTPAHAHRVAHHAPRMNPTSNMSQPAPNRIHALLLTLFLRSLNAQQRHAALFAHANRGSDAVAAA